MRRTNADREADLGLRSADDYRAVQKAEADLNRVRESFADSQRRAVEARRVLEAAQAAMRDAAAREMLGEGSPADTKRATEAVKTAAGKAAELDGLAEVMNRATEMLERRIAEEREAVQTRRRKAAEKRIAEARQRAVDATKKAMQAQTELFRCEDAARELGLIRFREHSSMSELQAAGSVGSNWLSWISKTHGLN